VARGDRHWRDAHTPTRLGLEANAHALARYAALCQEAEIVPIVEPEVLMDGGHSIERCFESPRQHSTRYFTRCGSTGSRWRDYC